VQPSSSRPAATACRSISPLGRPSRESTTVLPATEEPKAAANRAATSAVNPLPTRPRTPETVTIRTCSAMRESLRGAGGAILTTRGGNEYPESRPPPRPEPAMPMLNGQPVPAPLPEPRPQPTRLDGIRARVMFVLAFGHLLLVAGLLHR